MENTVFGEEWYKNFVSFRSNPKLFLDQRKLTRDVFCMDILKDLYSDVVNPECKYYLLLTLEQQSSFLIKDENLLEQIVGSLKNLYFIIEKQEDKKILKTQIFISLTTLLLSWEDKSENICAFIVDVRFFFLQIILSSTKDHHVRSTACQCLLEIEQFFPSISKDDLDDILSACQKDEQLPVENFAVLLSELLKNKTEQQQRRFSNELMDKALSKAGGSHRIMKKDENDLQVHGVVSFLVDAVPSMAPASVYLMFQNLIQVVINTPEMLPAVFKPFLPRMIMSFDLLYFHAAFQLLIAFGSELFTTQDEKLLIHQLFMSLKQPLLNVSQRMLYMDWLKTCLARKEIFSINITNCDSDLKILIPGPFDGPVMQAKKLCLLASCFQSRQNSGACCEFLLSCLTGLENQALVCKGKSVPVAFFQSLYTIFSLYDNVSMHSNVQRLVLDVAKSAPHLLPFVLDFLKVVKVECKKSDFSDNILTMLVDYVLNLPIRQFAANIDSFLPVLQRAAVEIPHTCKPQIAVRQLKKVLLNVDALVVDPWVIGHSILSVCCAFFKFHDLEVLYHDLGELLHLLIKNVKDIDCKDRAKQYYAALTALPQARVKGIFRTESHEKSGQSSLATFVTESENAFHSRNITQLPSPIFHLVRKEEKFQNSSTTLSISEPPNNGLKESYRTFISSDSFKPFMRIPFTLKHVDGIDPRYSVIYCVIITVKTDPPCNNVSTLQVPVLRVPTDINGEGSPEVELTFCPRIPHPVELHIRVQFTCGDGCMYSFSLPSMTVEFEDLFLPLPVTCSDDAWRKELFDELWKDIEETEGCLSVHRLKLTDLNHLVMEFWNPFVVTQESENSFIIGVLMPSLTHLLMKVKQEDDNVIANILVDDYRTFPYISTYLQKLESKLIQT